MQAVIIEAHDPSGHKTDTRDAQGQRRGDIEGGRSNIKSEECQDMEAMARTNKTSRICQEMSPPANLLPLGGLQHQIGWQPTNSRVRYQRMSYVGKPDTYY
jgi:hypothetical protein